MSTSTAAVTDRDTETVVQPIPGALIAGIGGPLALTATNAVVNFTPGWADASSASGTLDAIQAHPLATQVIIALGILSVVLLVPGIWAVTAVLRRRSPVWSAAGGWLMGTGYALSLALTTDTMTNLALADSGPDGAAWAEAIRAHAPVLQGLTVLLFGVGALLGSVLLGIAMLRQRGAVPAWAGWLLIASAPVRIAGLALGLAIGPPLSSAMITVAFAVTLLGARRSGR